MEPRSIVSSIALAALVVATAFLPSTVSAEPPALSHNGTNQFLIGVYDYPGGNAAGHLQEIAGSGINGYLRDIETTAGSDIDTAYNGYCIDTIVNAYPYIADVVWHETEFDAAINDLKNRTGLLMYENIDEPEYGWYLTGWPTLTTCTTGHQFVDVRDASHPVWVNFAAPSWMMAQPVYQGRQVTSSVYRQWTGVELGYAPGAGDVLSMDCYPVQASYPSNDLTQIGVNLESLKQVSDSTKPIFSVLQGCKWNQWDSDPSNDGPWPDSRETRFMAYSSIVHGARGVIWWGTGYIQPTDQMWSDIKIVAGELRDLQDVWANGSNATVDVSLGDSRLEAIMRIYNGKRYLIVANKSSATLSSKQIQVTGWNYAANPNNRIPVLFENNRTIAPSYTGTYTRWYDSFEPWGVHVYTDKTIRKQKTEFDFDGDGKSDLVLTRSGDPINWMIATSSSGYSTVLNYDCGSSALGDTILPADYDGDGKMDMAVFRPSWGYLYTWCSTMNYSCWAYLATATADIPLVGDYTGDGKADLVFYNGTTGTWRIFTSESGYAAYQTYTGFGSDSSGDVPITGDFDGDGKADLAFYRPSWGYLYWMRSIENYTVCWSSQVGGASSIAVPGDYDGDFATDCAVYDPGGYWDYYHWTIKRSMDDHPLRMFCDEGSSRWSDYVVPADYDGDGKTDVAFYRPGTAAPGWYEWFIFPSTTNGTTMQYQVTWNAADYVPVANGVRW